MIPHRRERALAVIRCLNGWRLLPEGPRREVFASPAAALQEAARIIRLANTCGVRTTLLVQEPFGELREIDAAAIPRAPKAPAGRPRRGLPRADALSGPSARRASLEIADATAE